jgi:hypothetical protein
VQVQVLLSAPTFSDGVKRSVSLILLVFLSFDFLFFQHIQRKPPRLNFQKKDGKWSKKFIRVRMAVRTECRISPLVFHVVAIRVRTVSQEK